MTGKNACSRQLENTAKRHPRTAFEGELKMYDDQIIKLPIGWMFRQCHDVDALCADIGLNPWCLNEGRTGSTDTHPITVGQAKKHGLLCGK